MGEQDVSGGIYDAHRTFRRDLEGLVVRAVFLGGLGHQADVGDGAHGLGIERAVGFAEVDGRLIDAGVAGVRDDGEGVAGLALGVPDLAAGADHRGHRGVDDDVAGDVEVGDALVGVDHRKPRAGGVGGLDVGFDLGLLVRGQLVELGDEVTEAVAEIDTEFLERRGVLGDQVFEEHLHRMAEDDRVADLHHGGLHVEREQHVVGLGFGDLGVEEGNEGRLAHEGGVEDFTGLEWGGFLEDLGRAVGGDELDLHVGGFGDADGLLVGEEVALAAHRRDGGLRIGGPGTHRVRVLLGVILHRLRCAAVGVAFAQDRIDGGAHDFGVAGLDVLFRVGLRVFREVRQCVAL